MNSKRLSVKLVQYELRNIGGNFFTVFFGIVFPIIMSVLFSQIYMKDLTGDIRKTAMTGLFITMSLIIPLSVLLIGYSVTYAQELEKDIPMRMNLFGFSQRTILAAKMIAYFIFMTGAFFLYTIVDCFTLDLQMPTISSAFCLIITLYLLGAVLFVLAHGIAGIFRKFGPTYAISMTLYFAFMILCGLMGIQVEDLPKTIRVVAYAFPMTYISNDYIDFWQGGSYNFAPIIQAFLFLGAVSGIVLLCSMRKNARVRK